MLANCTSLWLDESGSLAILESAFCLAIFVVGVTAGIIAYRSQFIQELGDVAVALESLDQSYTTSVPSGGSMASSVFTDTTTLTDPIGTPPAGISLSVGPKGE